MADTPQSSNQPSLPTGYSDALLAAIVSSSDDAIVSKDLNGVVTSWNKGAERIFGYSAEEIVGKSILTIIPLDRTSEEDMVLQAIRRGERVDHFETIRIRKDGLRVNISLTVSPIRDAQGCIVGASKVARDITAQKRVELQLAEAQQRLQQHAAELEKTVAARTAELKAACDDLEAFSYTVAHDLRVPVRNMVNYLSLLLEQLGPSPAPAQEDLVRKISNSAARLKNLIDDLLRLSRIGKQPLERRPTVLADLVHAVISELQPETAGRHIQWRVASLPVVECDPGLIQQVLSNLIANAVKFTRLRQSAIIDVGQLPGNDGPVFYVRDNGVGFDVKSAANLFTPFRRFHSDRQFEGTGIGLATVHRIIAKHGGRVWVEAEEDKGATFYFTLPPR